MIGPRLLTGIGLVFLALVCWEEGAKWEAKSIKQHLAVGVVIVLAFIAAPSWVPVLVSVLAGIIHEWDDGALRTEWLMQKLAPELLGLPRTANAPWQGIAEVVEFVAVPWLYWVIRALF